MAGTLFGLGLSQRVTLNGLPEAGWLLYIYDSGTSTPAATYADTGLTTELSFPIEADSYGMMPDFWVADGRYRARGTNSTGSAVFFDRDAILAIGPSSGSGGSGGGTVDPNAVLQTGDMLWKPFSGARTGFVRANGLTLGSVSSGATERANSDTQALFEYLWTNFSNFQCPVTSGRGGSATADFTANKAIGIYDMRGLAGFGLDDMGNSAAGIIPGGIAAGEQGGTATTPVLQANLPSYTIPNTLAAPAHTHSAGSFGVATTITVTNGATLTQGSSTSIQEGGGTTHTNMREGLSTQTVTAALNSGTVTGTSGAASATALTGTITSGGSGAELNTLSPFALGTWYIKL